MQKLFACLIFLSCSLHGLGQEAASAENDWVDSVYRSLNDKERIGQLIVMRLSSIDGKTRKVTFYDSLVSDCISKYNIGGICLFQGAPEKQASLINSLQARAKTPLLISIDGEWGLGMRMGDSIQSLPRQMMLGAVRDTHITYSYARVIADQCRRFGIHMDFAPVIDINNNPQNPVINDRSFGEDKERVAVLGRQYINGLQDAGIMACVKHFPGHGDVSVDSHYDLPVISKKRASLDSLELFPFRSLFNAGVSSVMVGHLFIPAIDSTPNLATSLSPKNVKELMQGELGFRGLSFTDALEMQGVKKFFPSGKSSVEALRAGNDMLLLPEDVPAAIDSVMAAIQRGTISGRDVEAHCRKVLSYKFRYGIRDSNPVDTIDITADLNRSIPSMRRVIAENAITLAAASNNIFFPLHPAVKKGELAYVSLGLGSGNGLALKLNREYKADSFYFPIITDSNYSASALIQTLESYDRIILGIHNISRRPQNHFGISGQALELLSALSAKNNVLVMLFGNPYAAANICEAKNLVICYEDDSITRATAADFLYGRLPYKGMLPVTVCDNLRSGTSLREPGLSNFVSGSASIDSIVYDAIEKKAVPGAVVLVAKEGKVVHHSAYGNFRYDYSEPVTTRSIYDVASVTKVCATTLAVMKLYEENKIILRKKISTYLPELKGKAIGKIPVEKLLLHEGGLPPTIPFQKMELDSAGMPLPGSFSADSSAGYPIRVADHVYAKALWKERIMKMIAGIRLEKMKKYVYSDIDFILLGKIVEKITGEPLDQYVSREFYCPLGLMSTTYSPRAILPLKQIAPTEDEKVFRRQLLRGDVHDPTAAMMGGVAGHAGLFSDAYDLYVIMQMLLNGGEYGGVRYFKKSTVTLFTDYHSSLSRRGLGFDKPEKDNATRPHPYPALEASPLSFGHLGFTGTCAWVDPTAKMVFVLLSNRVYPAADDKFVKMNIRTKVFEAIYRSPWIYYLH